jgi:transposase
LTKRKSETVNDFSRCLEPLDMDATLIAVIEMSQSSWLVAGIVPGVERQPLKKLAIDELLGSKATGRAWVDRNPIRQSLRDACRPSRQRPRRSRAAKERDELATSHLAPLMSRDGNIAR